ncbi:MAG: carboxypeptidase-like regulatory domain-containing protein [Planctomycetes bacterium]|nr:carboxypeptidase-like regulatory domain-containing protein [Planctomycetota bacterium]
MRSATLLVLLLSAGCDGPPPAGPPSGPVPVTGNATAPETPMLRGFVVDDAGRPLSGVAVRALIPLGAGHRARTEGLLATTAPDGSFALDLVSAFDPRPEVTVVLFAGLDGYIPFRQSVRTFRRAVGLSVEIRLFLGGTVTGRVVDPAGAPVPGATVFVAGPDEAGFARIDGIPSTVTGEDGAFAIRAVPPGTVDIGIRAEEFAPVVGGPLTVEAGKTTAAGDIALRPGGAITGFVRTPQGEPVAGAVVRAFRRPEYRDFAFFGRRSVAEAGGRVATDAAGGFRIPGLPDGAYTVETEAPGYLTVNAGARDVRPGTAPLSFLLAADSWIELTVMDAATGAPIPRYDLFLSPATGEGYLRREEVTGGGLHRVPVNRGEECRLEISAEGYEVLVRQISFADAGPAPLRISLAPR